MPSLSRDKQSSSVHIDVVDERNCIGSDLIFLEKLLQIDFPHYFMCIDIPMKQLGIKSTRDTEIAVI